MADAGGDESPLMMGSFDPAAFSGRDEDLILPGDSLFGFSAAAGLGASGASLQGSPSPLSPPMSFQASASLLPSMADASAASPLQLGGDPARDDPRRNGGFGGFGDSTKKRKLKGPSLMQMVDAAVAASASSAAKASAAKRKKAKVMEKKREGDDVAVPITKKGKHRTLSSVLSLFPAFVDVDRAASTSSCGANVDGPESEDETDSDDGSGRGGSDRRKPPVDVGSSSPAHAAGSLADGTLRKHGRPRREKQAEAKAGTEKKRGAADGSNAGGPSFSASRQTEGVGADAEDVPQEQDTCRKAKGRATMSGNNEAVARKRNTTTRPPRPKEGANARCSAARRRKRSGVVPQAGAAAGDTPGAAIVESTEHSVPAGMELIPGFEDTIDAHYMKTLLHGSDTQAATPFADTGASNGGDVDPLLYKGEDHNASDDDDSPPEGSVDASKGQAGSNARSFRKGSGLPDKTRTIEPISPTKPTLDERPTEPATEAEATESRAPPPSPSPPQPPPEVVAVGHDVRQEQPPLPQSLRAQAATASPLLRTAAAKDAVVHAGVTSTAKPSQTMAGSNGCSDIDSQARQSTLTAALEPTTPTLERGVSLDASLPAATGSNSSHSGVDDKRSSASREDAHSLHQAQTARSPQRAPPAAVTTAAATSPERKAERSGEAPDSTSSGKDEQIERKALPPAREAARVEQQIADPGVDNTPSALLGAATGATGRTPDPAAASSSNTHDTCPVSADPDMVNGDAEVAVDVEDGDGASAMATLALTPLQADAQPESGKDQPEVDETSSGKHTTVAAAVQEARLPLPRKAALRFTPRECSTKDKVEQRGYNPAQQLKAPLYKPVDAVFKFMMRKWSEVAYADLNNIRIVFEGAAHAPTASAVSDAFVWSAERGGETLIDLVDSLPEETRTRVCTDGVLDLTYTFGSGPLGPREDFVLHSDIGTTTTSGRICSTSIAGAMSGATMSSKARPQTAPTGEPRKAPPDPRPPDSPPMTQMPSVPVAATFEANKAQPSPRRGRRSGIGGAAAMPLQRAVQGAEVGLAGNQARSPQDVPSATATATTTAGANKISLLVDTEIGCSESTGGGAPCRAPSSGGGMSVEMAAVGLGAQGGFSASMHLSAVANGISDGQTEVGLPPLTTAPASLTVASAVLSTETGHSQLGSIVTTGSTAKTSPSASPLLSKEDAFCHNDALLGLDRDALKGYGGASSMLDLGDERSRGDVAVGSALMGEDTCMALFGGAGTEVELAMGSLPLSDAEETPIAEDTANVDTTISQSSPPFNQQGASAFAAGSLSSRPSPSSSLLVQTASGSNSAEPAATPRAAPPSSPSPPAREQEATVIVATAEPSAPLSTSSPAGYAASMANTGQPSAPLLSRETPPAKMGKVDTGEVTTDIDEALSPTSALPAPDVSVSSVVPSTSPSEVLLSSPPSSSTLGKEKGATVATVATAKPTSASSPFSPLDEKTAEPVAALAAAVGAPPPPSQDPADAAATASVTQPSSPLLPSEISPAKAEEVVMAEGSPDTNEALSLTPALPAPGVTDASAGPDTHPLQVLPSLPSPPALAEEGASAECDANVGTLLSIPPPHAPTNGAASTATTAPVNMTSDEPTSPLQCVNDSEIATVASSSPSVPLTSLPPRSPRDGTPHPEQPTKSIVDSGTTSNSSLNRSRSASSSSPTRKPVVALGSPPTVFTLGPRPSLFTLGPRPSAFTRPGPPSLVSAEGPTMPSPPLPPPVLATMNRKDDDATQPASMDKSKVSEASPEELQGVKKAATMTALTLAAQSPADRLSQGPTEKPSSSFPLNPKARPSEPSTADVVARTVTVSQAAPTVKPACSTPGRVDEDVEPSRCRAEEGALGEFRKSENKRPLTSALPAPVVTQGQSTDFDASSSEDRRAEREDERGTSVASRGRASEDEVTPASSSSMPALSRVAAPKSSTNSSVVGVTPRRTVLPPASKAVGKKTPSKPNTVSAGSQDRVLNVGLSRKKRPRIPPSASEPSVAKQPPIPSPPTAARDPLRIPAASPAAPVSPRPFAFAAAAAADKAKRVAERTAATNDAVVEGKRAESDVEVTSRGSQSPAHSPAVGLAMTPPRRTRSSTTNRVTGSVDAHTGEGNRSTANDEQSPPRSLLSPSLLSRNDSKTTISGLLLEDTPVKPSVALACSGSPTPASSADIQRGHMHTWTSFPACFWEGRTSSQGGAPIVGDGSNNNRHEQAVAKDEGDRKVVKEGPVTRWLGLSTSTREHTFQGLSPFETSLAAIPISGDGGHSAGTRVVELEEAAQNFEFAGRTERAAASRDDSGRSTAERGVRGSMSSRESRSSSADFAEYAVGAASLAEDDEEARSLPTLIRLGRSMTKGVSTPSPSASTKNKTRPTFSTDAANGDGNSTSCPSVVVGTSIRDRRKRSGEHFVPGRKSVGRGSEHASLPTSMPATLALLAAAAEAASNGSIGNPTCHDNISATYSNKSVDIGGASRSRSTIPPTMREGSSVLSVSGVVSRPKKRAKKGRIAPTLVSPLSTSSLANPATPRTVKPVTAVGSKAFSPP